MKCLYFDCFSGISGDMVLGALVDLGVPQKYLKEELSKLGIKDYSVSFSSAVRMGISGRRVIVKDLHEKSGHYHRTYAEIEKIINKSRIINSVKEKSIDIFRRIAKAEAKIHNRKISEVHFHEVGAIDSIVDIVGSVAGVDFLGVDECIASTVPLGSGFVKCQHGTIPVPAPATLEILKGVPVYSSGVKSELVTPTGAAILTGFVKEFKPLPQMKIIKTGFGAGKRVYEEVPNLLRLILGDMNKKREKDEVWVVETNVDDMNPEWTGFLMDSLFEAGALDVFMVPVYMKKNRPGIELKVICDDKKREELTNIIFRESTTAGVRSYPVERDILKRREGKLKTKFGVLKVKILEEGKSERIVPEFEECKKVALKRKIPLRKVYEDIYDSANKTG
jgi:uncharacterized protein (TIGR00299 family) protein